MLKIKQCPKRLLDYYTTLVGLSHVESNCSEEGGYIYNGYSIHYHPSIDMPDIRVAFTTNLNSVITGTFQPSEEYNKITLENILYSIDENTKMPT